MYEQGESLSSVTPDILHIPCKNKINKTPDTLIIKKEHIQEPVNPRKRSKDNTLTDVKKCSPKETPLSFWHEVDNKCDTNEKNRVSYDSASETEGCVRNLAKENENEEVEEFKEDIFEINDINESKLSKDDTEEAIISSLLAKIFLPKVIKDVIFYINIYEQL